MPLNSSATEMAATASMTLGVSAATMVKDAMPTRPTIIGTLQLLIGDRPRVAELIASPTAHRTGHHICDILLWRIGAVADTREAGGSGKDPRDAAPRGVVALPGGTAVTACGA